MERKDKTMKNMKKMMAIVIVAVMTLMYAVPMSFAEEGTGKVTKDTTVTVSGLEAGDSVKFIKVIEWVDGTGWAWTSAIKAADEADATLALPDIKTITGNVPPATPANNGEISAEHAGIIAKLAAGLSGTSVPADETTKKAVLDPADSGLYYAQVTPGTADYMYNTIFVGADFKSDNETDTINAAEDKLNAKENEEAVAKKEQITLTKESEGTTDDVKYDHNVGDVIPFTITSKVPAYGDGYVNPHYVLTDVLETGFTLTSKNAVSGAASTTAATKNDITVTVGSLNLVADTDYEVKDVSPTGFKVEMKAAGLAKVAATGEAQTITVTYKAKLETLENVTVTEKTNTATVDFSNKPTDESSYSLIEDKTRHYTFSLDSQLLGQTGKEYVTDELVKVGQGPNGEPLTQKKNYHSGTTWSEQSPLQGAKFALYKSAPEEADYNDLAAAQASTKLYTNTSFNGIVESDADGRLKIEGLDEGTYYLREVAAPTGYIRDNRTFIITIAATYTEIPAGYYYKNSGNTTPEDENDIKVNYDKYKVLDGYTVKVNDGTNDVISTYLIKAKGEVQTETVDKLTYTEITGDGAGSFAGDAITPITNTQGTELPSTGGIGTTIFYIIGTLLVLGAGVLLVTRRRMRSSEE